MNHNTKTITENLKHNYKFITISIVVFLGIIMALSIFVPKEEIPQNPERAFLSHLYTAKPVGEEDRYTTADIGQTIVEEDGYVYVPTMYREKVSTLSATETPVDFEKFEFINAATQNTATVPEETQKSNYITELTYTTNIEPQGPVVLMCDGVQIEKMTIVAKGVEKFIYRAYLYLQDDPNPHKYHIDGNFDCDPIELPKKIYFNN